MTWDAGRANGQPLDSLYPNENPVMDGIDQDMQREQVDLVRNCFGFDISDQLYIPERSGENYGDWIKNAPLDPNLKKGHEWITFQCRRAQIQTFKRLDKKVNEFETEFKEKVSLNLNAFTTQLLIEKSKVIMSDSHTDLSRVQVSESDIQLCKRNYRVKSDEVSLFIFQLQTMAEHASLLFSSIRVQTQFKKDIQRLIQHIQHKNIRGALVQISACVQRYPVSHFLRSAESFTEIVTSLEAALNQQQEAESEYARCLDYYFEPTRCRFVNLLERTDKGGIIVTVSNNEILKYWQDGYKEWVSQNEVKQSTAIAPKEAGPCTVKPKIDVALAMRTTQSNQWKTTSFDPHLTIEEEGIVLKGRQNGLLTLRKVHKKLTSIRETLKSIAPPHGDDELEQRIIAHIQSMVGMTKPTGSKTDIDACKAAYVFNLKQFETMKNTLNGLLNSCVFVIHGDESKKRFTEEVSALIRLLKEKNFATTQAKLTAWEELAELIYAEAFKQQFSHALKELETQLIRHNYALNEYVKYATPLIIPVKQEFDALLKDAEEQSVYLRVEGGFLLTHWYAPYESAFALMNQEDVKVFPPVPKKRTKYKVVNKTQVTSKLPIQQQELPAIKEKPIPLPRRKTVASTGKATVDSRLFTATENQALPHQQAGQWQRNRTVELVDDSDYSSDPDYSSDSDNKLEGYRQFLAKHKAEANKSRLETMSTLAPAPLREQQQTMTGRNEQEYLPPIEGQERDSVSYSDPPCIIDFISYKQNKHTPTLVYKYSVSDDGACLFRAHLAIKLKDLTWCSKEYTTKENLIDQLQQEGSTALIKQAFVESIGFVYESGLVNDIGEYARRFEQPQALAEAFYERTFGQAQFTYCIGAVYQRVLGLNPSANETAMSEENKIRRVTKEDEFANTFADIVTHNIINKLGIAVQQGLSYQQILATQSPFAYKRDGNSIHYDLLAPAGYFVH
ncbi:hypothetical protein D5018_09255 [Parashewanella curva]|uniref:OTU domain-containing protein n=1 Tax=Parashewanella curva TaxID=2338552 RepID=A0A3L8PXD2_9GAMM|nr:hypothetical protein [Parashewanella curva]RLV59981.1 hypothetical protein D5018_09255 [Parashewanella curva]